MPRKQPIPTTKEILDVVKEFQQVVEFTEKTGISVGYLYEDYERSAVIIQQVLSLIYREQYWIGLEAKDGCVDAFFFTFSGYSGNQIPDVFEEIDEEFVESIRDSSEPIFQEYLKAVEQYLL